MKSILIALLLIATMGLLQRTIAQPGDELWQQLVGAKEAQCSQNVIDAAREINKLKAQVDDLQKQLKAKDTGGK